MLVRRRNKYNDTLPEPKLQFKSQCPICHQFIELRDDGKLKRHAKLERSSKNIRHKCNGTYLLVKDHLNV